MRRPALRLAVESQCAILCGLLFLVPRIGHGLSQIAVSTQLALQQDRASALHRLSPYLGEEALPAGARELVQIARAHQLADFKLSRNLGGERGLVQRVTEGAWPIQLTQLSRHLFLRCGEPLPPMCELRSGGIAVDYADCD
jgi:hypothetical protein